jgi:GNAT superfamily N-acetyltransferase
VIRTATSDDLALVRDLWWEFDQEIPDAPWRDPDTEQDLDELATTIRDGVVLLADDVGLAVATMRSERLGFLDVLYVRPEARGRGLARELVTEAAARLRDRGAEVVELEVLESNEQARTIYRAWGFAPVEHILAVPVEQLLGRLAGAGGPTFGSIHVQSDDVGAVTRAVEKALPRLGRSERVSVSDASNGWISVRSTLTDESVNALRSLAKELSYTSGGVSLALGVEDGALVHYTLYDRGAAVDEYASVPEYHGPLPPGDVIALGANPTVVARLTGADPARVREVARTAASPSDLPPWNELYAQIAELMGVDADVDAL